MFRILILLAFSVFLVACNAVQKRPSDAKKSVLSSAYARQAHERAMQSKWEGKPMKELVAAMGEPQMIMSIPRYGWPPSAAVVFGVDQATGCVDAFLVVAGEENKVYNYFCR